MKWLYSASDPILITIYSSILIFIVIIIFTRIIGLRSFAKFTAYDFAFTIAIGSILSSILTSSTSVVHGSVAIIALLAITYLVSTLQRKSKTLCNLISNDPLLLMDGSKILNQNLKKARIEKNQLIAKLREANVLNYDQVIAVVLESTGDISVLHKSSADEDIEFNKELLSGVKR